MIPISVNDMQRDLLSYLSRVRAGETVLIMQEGPTVAELKPVASQQRPFGLCAGQFTVPDDFNVPLPELALKEFEGE